MDRENWSVLARGMSEKYGNVRNEDSFNDSYNDSDDDDRTKQATKLTKWTYYWKRKRINSF